MNRRIRSACKLPQNVGSGARARCSVGAALIALLVFITQIGPALACDVFDGPDGSGCPALFHSDPAPLGSDIDHHPPDDCSNGPAYLALAVYPLQLQAPSSGTDDGAAPLRAIAAYEFPSVPAHSSHFFLSRSPIHRGDAQHRYAYLETLRLRI